MCNLIFERRHEVARLLEINEILSEYVFVRRKRVVEGDVGIRPGFSTEMVQGILTEAWFKPCGSKSKGYDVKT